MLKKISEAFAKATDLKIGKIVTKFGNNVRDPQLHKDVVKGLSHHVAVEKTGRSLRVTPLTHSPVVKIQGQQYPSTHLDNTDFSGVADPQHLSNVPPMKLSMIKANKLQLWWKEGLPNPSSISAQNIDKLTRAEMLNRSTASANAVKKVMHSDGKISDDVS